MKDYSAMSDFEINVNVSLELFEGSSGGDVSRVATWCACKENGAYGLFDPCNNPADAWPIIFRERITLTPKVTGYEWDAISPVILNDDIEHLHTGPNPLRSAMIVFLMMKESIHAKTSE
ncbi:phage protein NinX family protein [Yersinia frederiksenii]|uniref:Protein of uncharacterized function (DUF2591) n=1 Tax=Yersinia frederiksenii TaxID=29484 RepID=A0AAI8ZPQ2_YERFR|nr:phage protein NinX family protein [Yersinia frederiksenii]CFQ95928.1 Protein of uncharacterised function (DUF2591) [Yersinia frederiksenii]